MSQSKYANCQLLLPTFNITFKLVIIFYYCNFNIILERAENELSNDIK